MAYINKLAKALIKLNDVKQAYVSKESEVQKGNLSIWLQGKRKLSEEAEERILGALGVVSGALDINKVHCWSIGADLTDLNFVLAELCPNPELQYLMSTSLVTKVTHYPLIAIKNRAGLKIVIKQKSAMNESKNLKVKSYSISTDTIPNSKWLIDKQPRAVAEKVYDLWQKGEVLMTDFDEYVTSEDIAWTWEDVLDKAEDNEISAAEVMNALNSIIQNRSKYK